MSKSETIHSQRFRLSVIERLQGEESATVSDEGDALWSQHLAHIAADLKHLLNTRQHYDHELIRSFGEVRESLFTYGFPEINSLQAGNEEALAELGRHLESVIKRFEPRLQRVQVSPQPGASPGEAAFRVAAEVKASPAPVRVVFDTSFDVERRRYEVRGHRE